MVLVLNGIPVFAFELKNQYTGQTVNNAKIQWMEDRDPREICFQFNKRILAYFCVDHYEVWMATKLAGKKTFFLPFNQGSNGSGSDGGKGNPANPDGYPTAYLWENVFQKESMMDIIQKFIHLKDGKTLIFPRFHQLDVVRKLLAHVSENGSGHNYLIQHSAGSGKSNSITWTAYRLASLFNAENKPVFSSVIRKHILSRKSMQTSSIKLRKSFADLLFTVITILMHLKKCMFREVQSRMIKCFSVSDSNRVTSFENLPLGDYYVACKVRVDRYVAGDAGIVINGGGNSNVPVAAVNETTNNEFVTASGFITVSDATEVSFIMGSSNQADLDCYVDDIVFIPLSAFEEDLTQTQLDDWYEEYRVNHYESYADIEEAKTEKINTFIIEMNEKAQEIGMTNTSISTADGNGGSSDYSTARDAMKMIIAASKKDIIAEIWQNTYSNDVANGTYTFTVNNGGKERNKTVKTTITNETLLANFDILGGKTGTGGTRCIGVIAEIDGQKVVAVIMGATSEANRYSAINDLLGIASNKIADSSFNASTETVEDAPSAIAAIITDDGYEVLYEQEADTRQNLASMTKVLNVLTALDYIEEPKVEKVTVQYSESGDFYMYDEITYENAFYCLLLPSSNTTAKVVARSIGEMNSKS